MQYFLRVVPLSDFLAPLSAVSLLSCAGQDSTQQRWRRSSTALESKHALPTPRKRVCSLCAVVWCGVTWRGVAWCGGIVWFHFFLVWWFGAVLFVLFWFSSVWLGSVCFGSVRFGSIRLVWFGLVWLRVGG